MTPNQPNIKLFASLERAALAQTLAGIQLTGGPGGSAAVLSQRAEDLDAVSLPLSRIARSLAPLGMLDAQQAGALRRLLLPILSTYAENVAGSLRVLAAGGLAAPGQGDQAAQIQELLKKRDVFSGLRLLGMQAMNIGLDQRQISGAFLVFLVDRVVGAVDRRFNDPRATQVTRDRLLADFGPGLMELDDVLRAPQLRNEQLSAARAQLSQRAEDAQADAQLEEASLRLRQQLVLPRELLFAAARRYVQRQAAEGAGVPGVPTIPGGPPPGGILR
jgi:hypothetical protein